MSMSMSKSLCYGTNKMDKNQDYDQRILQIENGSVTPLVFSINSGMGKELNKCYFRIDEKVAQKRDEPYSVTIS